MSHSVRFRLDDDAAAELTALRARLRAAGIAVPTDRPAVTFAAAAAIPPAARAALADELRVLALPALWLAILGTIAGRDDELVLAAIVDAELLAVHAAVHDALTGRVRAPAAAYLPGAWLPHCTLSHERPAAAFALLHPFPPVRAGVIGVELVDTRTGAAEPIAWTRGSREDQRYRGP
ncbi:hypothetical protein [Pseudonocardia asaccharolytica]|uniref:2'-5' RNA ligase n=1 Tax=Pseudonocardia asaccharolytica DSM 44247 = NBRC 16224 TaxID=1123024 RepID=A0A511CY05_9PSEU|nr:hypothetical protein [Pseudonocardia asaccharolytica]GEL17441.1 hypothetical protein PA7_12780 [Pseudonocardia asaccharolytica DSM 44247 = NBRC 16224]